MLSPFRVHPSDHASDSRGAHSSRFTSDHGMATLETALMIPVLLAVTLTFISLLHIGMQVLSLSDATRTVARELARGAEVDSVIAAFSAREPGATIDLDWNEKTVTVLTSRAAELPINAFGFSPFTLEQQHTAPREWR